MKRLVHIASGVRAQIGHCIFNRSTGEKHIITNMPNASEYGYGRIGYHLPDGSYRDIGYADAGLMWDKPWRIRLCYGDTVEYAGYTFKVKFPDDFDAGASWERGDGYGIVSEPTTRPKRPGEREIGYKEWGRRRLYDVQGSMDKAKRERWNAPPYTETKGERAARAVQADYEFHDAWLKDEWHFVGIEIECLDADGLILGEDSCWGFETWKDYHEEAAWDMIEALAEQVKGEQAAKAEAARIAEELAEAERADLQSVANDVWHSAEQYMRMSYRDAENIEDMKRAFNRICAKAGVTVE